MAHRVSEIPVQGNVFCESWTGGVPRRVPWIQGRFVWSWLNMRKMCGSFFGILKEQMLYFQVTHFFLITFVFDIAFVRTAFFFEETSFSLRSFAVRERKIKITGQKKKGHFLEQCSQASHDFISYIYMQQPANQPSMLTPRCQRLQQLCQELESESWTVHLGDQRSYGKPMDSNPIRMDLLAISPVMGG